MSMAIRVPVLPVPELKHTGIFFLSIIDFHHLDIKISVFELNGN